MAEETELIQEVLQNAINRADDYAEGEKGVVTKWVVIAEVVGSEAKTLWFHTSKDLKVWESIGMLESGLNREMNRDSEGWED